LRAITANEVIAMTIEYINRRGKKHYLHEGQTKTGKPKYYFSQKNEGNLAEIIPDGYEIYEMPSNAHVLLRKVLRQLITSEEIALVKKGIEKYTKMKEKREFLLDVKEKYLVVYLCDQNLENLINNLAESGRLSRKKSAEIVLQEATYSGMMRFTLKDQESRDFWLERWYFRGLVDGWIELDYDDLPTLVKKYVKHLNQTSFLDLFLGS
jgi:hypothetical protein